MVYKDRFYDNGYGALVEENGVFVNRGDSIYMKTPRTVPNYGYLNGEKKSIFNCYQAYIGNDQIFDTWILIRDTHVDIVNDCQFIRSFDADNIEFDKIADGAIDIVGSSYQIYLSPLTDSKRTDRYYMGVKLYKRGKVYKNCRIIFGLGINPNGIDESENSRYDFTKSELQEIHEWFNS